MKPTRTNEFLQTPLSPRLEWLSGLRGICSLWIVYYHLYVAYTRTPLPKINASFLKALYEHYNGLDWGSRMAGFSHDLLTAMSLHAVGIFILMSGFGLTRSLLKQGSTTPNWGAWYRKRFWRLYPFFWFAHLIFLFAPFIWRAEACDWRFLVSLTGIRAYPMELMLFYANPAWWFFWLILQLYLFFPLLYRLFLKFSIPWFLLITLAITFISRWLILFVWEDWRGMIIGGLFTSRLAEFCLGMALAHLWQINPDRFAQRITGWKFFASGCLLYPFSLLFYSTKSSYIFVDFLTTLGIFLLASPLAYQLCRIRMIHSALAFAGSVSLSTFLLHQPWALTLGESLKGQPLIVFFPTATAFLFLMVWIAFASEQTVRIIASRLNSLFPAARD